MRPTDPQHWKIVWDQLRERDGMTVSPLDLRAGDRVAVTGTGECNRQLRRFDSFTGVVDRAGWVGDHFEFVVDCQEWTALPMEFWADPVATFDNVSVVERVTRY